MESDSPSHGLDYDMKNDVFWDVRRVALVRTNVSEELSASIFKVKRIGDRGTKLAVTSNRRKLGRNIKSVGC
jgi:hypothetical protein